MLGDVRHDEQQPPQLLADVAGHALYLAAIAVSSSATRARSRAPSLTAIAPLAARIRDTAKSGLPHRNVTTVRSPSVDLSASPPKSSFAASAASGPSTI